MSGAIHVQPMTLRGIQRTGPSSFHEESGSGAEFAAATWFALIDELVQRDMPLDHVMYGVSWPADTHVPPREVHYFCGFESAANVEGLATLHVEGGKYFDFHCAVPANDLDSGFRDAYDNALPASGLTPREGQHLEIYGDDYDPSADVARFRILIPVE